MWLIGSRYNGRTREQIASPYLYLRRHSSSAGWAGIIKEKTWWCFVGVWHTDVSSPGVAVFVSFVAQTKHVRFENVGTSALHTLPFVLNQGDARDRSLIGKGVLIAPPFIGQFCVSRCLIYYSALACRPFDRSVTNWWLIDLLSYGSSLEYRFWRPTHHQW